MKFGTGVSWEVNGKLCDKMAPCPGLCDSSIVGLREVGGGGRGAAIDMGRSYGISAIPYSARTIHIII